MNKISFSILLTMFTVFVVLTMSVPYALNIKEYTQVFNDDIQIAQNELRGTVLLDEILKIQAHFFNHLEDKNSSDDNSLVNQINQIRDELLDETKWGLNDDAREQVNLAVADVQSIHLRIRTETLPRQRLMSWIEVTADLRNIVTVLADKSFLIVDSEKSSAYLINCIVDYAPKLIQSILSNLLELKDENKGLTQHLFYEDLRSFKLQLRAISQSTLNAVFINSMLVKIDDLVTGSQPEKERLKTLAFYISDSLLSLNKELRQSIDVKIKRIEELRDRKINRIIMNWIYMILIVGCSLALLLYTRNKMKLVINSQQRQLEISAKKAIVGEFAASIGHEIINPVTAISGFAEVIQSRINKSNVAEKEKIKEYLEKISKYSERIIGIIKSLKNLVKEDLSAELRSVLIVETFADIEQIFQKRFNKLGIEFQKNIEFQDLTCLGSEIEIFQIITNFISNSIDAVEHSAKKVISLEASCCDYGVVIRVTDSGPGISKELREKVFESMFTTKVEGTGLGLQICVKLAHRMQGQIVLKETGSGACFELHLKTVPILAKKIARV